MQIRSIFQFTFISILIFLLFPFTIYAATTAKPGTNTGLVGYWSFNEGTSTTAGDMTVYKNNGTLTSMSSPPTATSGWGSGKLGKGLNFDGTDDWVNVGNTASLNGATKFTWTGWVYFNDLNLHTSCIGYNQNLFQRGSSGYYNGYIWLALNTDNTLIMNIEDAVSGLHVTTSSNTISAGRWYHVAAVADTTSFVIYLNGVPGTATNYNGMYALMTGGTAVGNRTQIGSCDYSVAAGQTGYMSGKIDEVRVYNRALSAAEIMTLYKSGASIQKVASKNGLVGQWKFDEGSGIYANDTSGLKNIGTLTGANGLPVWSNGKLGKALNFDGVDDYVDVGVGTGSLDQLGNVFTISAWIKTPTPNSRMTIFSTGYSGAGPVFGTSANTPGGLEIYYPGIYVAYTVGSLLNANTWYHVVYTRSGTGAGTHTFYINGVSQTLSSDTASNFTDTSVNKYIGYRSGVMFYGQIDEVRVYNRALTAAEVLSIYRENATAMNAPQNDKLTSGLVGLWTFNGKDIVNGVAMDRSGKGNNGNLISIATSTFYTYGKIGQAFKFDGINDYVEVADNVNLNPSTSAFSVSVWFKMTGDGGLSNAILYNKENLFEASAGGGYFTYAWQPHWAWDGGTSFPVSIGQWYHAVVVYDKAKQYVYKNGVEVYNRDQTGDIGTNTETLRIGRRSNAFSSYFPGVIDDLRIYNRALSPAEVKQLYNLGK